MVYSESGKLYHITVLFFFLVYTEIYKERHAGRIRSLGGGLRFV